MRPILSFAALLALSACATTPRNDRTWYPYLAQTSDVTSAVDGRFSVTPVSQWRYDASGPVAQTYGAAHYNINDVQGVWFVLEPQPGSNLAAHTLLLFEFPGERLLGLTIEARREEGEDYSALRGVFNTFELSYVWADARDLLTRRAVMLDHEVFVYPTALDLPQRRFLLRRLLERTETLETRPRFYNTLFSNCTNELAKAADLSWNPAFVLTGTSDEFLFREAMIPGATFEAARTDANVTQFLKAWNAGQGVGAEADFDRDLLAELRRRLSD